MTVADVVYQWLEKLKAADKERIEEWKRWKEEDKARRRERDRERRMRGRVVVAQSEPVEAKKWTRELKPKPAPPVRKSQEEKRQQKKIFIEHKMFGYIYLIRSENGFYKIGLSKNIKQRLSGLQSQYPIQMGVIHSFACHDVRKVEKNLHKMFEKKRAQNEWFRLEPDDVTWIMGKKDYSLG